MKAIVAKEGKVTIPKALRDRLGIHPDTVLDFREDGGRLIVVKVDSADPVSKVYGCLTVEASVDELVRQMRDRQP